MKTRHVRLIENKLLRVHFTSSFMGDWTLKAHFGRGAGYIGGFSAWIGNAVHSWTFGAAPYAAMYRRRFSLGMTRNGNRMPWTRN